MVRRSIQANGDAMKLHQLETDRHWSELYTLVVGKPFYLMGPMQQQWGVSAISLTIFYLGANRQPGEMTEFFKLGTVFNYDQVINSFIFYA